MKVVAQEIKRAWDLGCNEVHLNVAGGRKDMCISASIVGSFLNVNSVFHIISPDVKTANMELERMREKINELHKAEDKISYYNQNKKDFDLLMFPDTRTWYAVDIPILPYPKSLLRLCKKILSKDIVRYDELKGEKLDSDLLDALQKLGYADVTKKEIRVTELGKTVGDIIPE
jgi:CRISPR-associated protein Csx14